MKYFNEKILMYFFSNSIRYYIAQCRNQSWNLVSEQDLENEENVEENNKNQVATSSKHSKDAKLGGPQGLARLGSRAALSFAFAFLRRAWRNGEDSDLCTDLLQGVQFETCYFRFYISCNNSSSSKPKCA